MMLCALNDKEQLDYRAEEKYKYSFLVYSTRYNIRMSRKTPNLGGESKPKTGAGKFHGMDLGATLKEKYNHQKLKSFFDITKIIQCISI